MVLAHATKGSTTTNLTAKIKQQYPQSKDIITMQKATKENIQLLSAIAMLFGGFALAVAGFIVPPTGQIHESVLGIFAECLNTDLLYTDLTINTSVSNGKET